jgi:GT2 family glycosyltransferase
MKIYVLIPVHNRLVMTTKCVEDLLQQDFDGELEIVIIDDGSTDGTSEYLTAQLTGPNYTRRKLSVIRGAGDWWWTKCIQEGLLYVRPQLREEDCVLFLNDDVRLKSDYVTELVSISNHFEKSIVMSQLVSEDDPSNHVVSPIKIDAKRLQVTQADSIKKLSSVAAHSDVAPGRGTLYPARPIIDGHSVDVKRLPHYIADYEFSVRVRNLGYSIVCALDAHVLTTTEWGNSRHRGGLRWRLFAKESPEKIGAIWAFWRTSAPEVNCLHLAFRLLRYRILPALVDKLLSFHRRK